MNHLLKPVLKNLLKQKSTWLLLIMVLFPLAIIITTSGIFETNFMQLEGEPNSFSGLGFLVAMISTQHQMVFPSILLAFIASLLFYDEIKSGRLVIFKDNSRKDIFSSKRSALFIVFVFYFVAIALVSLFAYFVTANNVTISTGQLMPADSSETRTLLLELIGYFLTEIIGLSITFTVSIFLNSGYTIIVAIFYQLLSMIAPQLASVKYLFPTGYGKMSGSAILIIGEMLLVTVICLVASYIIGKRLFEKVEF